MTAPGRNAPHDLHQGGVIDRDAVGRWPAVSGVDENAPLRCRATLALLTPITMACL